VRIGESLVIDTNTFATDGRNAVKSRRYLSALLANLGASFVPPVAGPASTALALDRFTLIGDSPYYEAGASRLTIRSNALIEAPFTAAAAGNYGIVLRGSSSPYDGVYCKVRVLIDRKPVGEIKINADQTADFGPLQTELDAGDHILGIEFFNDASGNGEDRNLLLDGVRFVEP
jgi:hypothetical protein